MHATASRQLSLDNERQSDCIILQKKSCNKSAPGAILASDTSIEAAAAENRVVW
jgi:hypothetical protein